jgi:hypothetical protein
MLEFIRSDSQSIVLAAARDRRGVGSFGASRSIDCLSNIVSTWASQLPQG